MTSLKVWVVEGAELLPSTLMRSQSASTGAPRSALPRSLIPCSNLLGAGDVAGGRPRWGGVTGSHSQ